MYMSLSLHKYTIY